MTGSDDVAEIETNHGQLILYDQTNTQAWLQSAVVVELVDAQ